MQAQLAKYQNPAEADKLMAIQKDLDQTTAIMHDTIEAALDRGVKLDELIEKSEDLSSSSKMFYKVSLLSALLPPPTACIKMPLLCTDSRKAKSVLLYYVSEVWQRYNSRWVCIYLSIGYSLTMD